MIKNIFLIRHGQTALNAQHLIQGQGIDAPLDDTGRQQAILFSEAYQHINFDLVVYSSLLRSKQSARPFLVKGYAGLEAHDLREISWGLIEGKENAGEAAEDYTNTNAAWDSGDFDATTQGGESIRSLSGRCQNFLNWFLKLELENVLIVGHGRIIRVLGCLLTGEPLTNMQQFPHTNMGVYLFNLAGDKYEVRLNNDTRHLHGLS